MSKRLRTCLTTARINRLADEMLTEEFIMRLHLAKNAMGRSLAGAGPYGDRELARDLEVPLPIARLLLSFIGAICGEVRMNEILAASTGSFSEAQH
mgnify:CR=1 FL=1